MLDLTNLNSFKTVVKSVNAIEKFLEQEFSSLLPNPANVASYKVACLKRGLTDITKDVKKEYNKEMKEAFVKQIVAKKRTQLTKGLLAEDAIKYEKELTERLALFELHVARQYDQIEAY